MLIFVVDSAGNLFRVLPIVEKQKPGKAATNPGDLQNVTFAWSVFRFQTVAKVTKHFEIKCNF